MDQGARQLAASLPGVRRGPQTLAVSGSCGWITVAVCSCEAASDGRAGWAAPVRADAAVRRGGDRSRGVCRVKGSNRPCCTAGIGAAASSRAASPAARTTASNVLRYSSHASQCWTPAFGWHACSPDRLKISPNDFAPVKCQLQQSPLAVITASRPDTITAALK